MSAAAPLRRPATVRLPATASTRAVPQRKPVAVPRPRLVLVSQRRATAGRLPFVILIGSVLVLGLVGVLALHMFAAQDSFQVTKLQDQLNGSTDQLQQLQQTVDADSSPSALRQRAVALGMVPSTVTEIHRLHDGRTIGLQTPIIAAAPTTTTTTTTTTSTASTSTKTTAGAATKSATATAPKSGTSPKSGTPTKAGTATTATGASTSTSSTTTKHHGHHHGGATKP